MSEPAQLIVPVSPQPEGNSYPWMRREQYVFGEGAVLHRDVPYWRPAVERIVYPSGRVQYATPQHEARAEVLESVGDMLRAIGDRTLAAEYSQFLNAMIEVG
jgi:hypothetical protein